jgi:MFS family permease
MLVGPPISGGLFDRFGFRGPYIFGIAVAVVDLLGRLLIIERREALLWGIDTLATEVQAENTVDVERAGLPSESSENSNAVTKPDCVFPESKTPEPPEDQQVPNMQASHPSPQHLSLFAVIYTLCKSSRAVTAAVNTFAYAYAID